MLPLVDTAVLQANPAFESLYSTLTNDVLHPDGSTKNHPAADRRDATRHALGEYRLEAAKRHLLKNAMATVPPSSSTPPARQHQRTKSQLSKPPPQNIAQLPPELVDLLLLIPAFLSRAQNIRTAELELLLSSPPFSDFPSLLPRLTTVLSSHLTAQARGLARVLHPTTNPSFIHRAVPQILPATQALLSRLSAGRAALTLSRLSATSDLTTHLNQHTGALSLLLQALEDKHGPAAHSSTLRASQASLEAQLWATSLHLLLWETRAQIYPPQSQTALQNYRHHLRDAQMQLSNKLRTREQELGEYGVFISSEEGGLGIGKADEAREHKFREMARVWREMEKRLKEINGDLKRLDKS